MNIIYNILILVFMIAYTIQFIYFLNMIYKTIKQNKKRMK